MWALASPLLAEFENEVARSVFQPDRIGPLDELINVFELEEVARKNWHNHFTTTSPAVLVQSTPYGVIVSFSPVSLFVPEC